MVPKPRFAKFDNLFAHLAEQCRKVMGDKLRGHKGPIGERFEAEAERLLPLPVAPYDACGKQLVRVALYRFALLARRGHFHRVRLRLGLGHCNL